MAFFFWCWLLIRKLFVAFGFAFIYSMYFSKVSACLFRHMTILRPLFDDNIKKMNEMNPMRHIKRFIIGSFYSQVFLVLHTMRRGIYMYYIYIQFPWINFKRIDVKKCVSYIFVFCRFFFFHYYCWCFFLSPHIFFIGNEWAIRISR